MQRELNMGMDFLLTIHRKQSGMTRGILTYLMVIIEQHFYIILVYQKYQFRLREKIMKLGVI